jgi:hypothetical protein
MNTDLTSLWAGIRGCSAEMRGLLVAGVGGAGRVHDLSYHAAFRV